MWSVKVIRTQHEKETGKSISMDTVRRALHDTGFSSKRPKKTVRFMRLKKKTS